MVFIIFRQNMMYHVCILWKGVVVDDWGKFVGGRDGGEIVCSMMG